MRAALDFIVRWAAVALAVLALLACVKMAQLQAELAEARLEASTERADREQAARMHERKLAALERTHATAQQTKDEEYAKGKNALAGELRVALADAGRMRSKLAEATARDRAGDPTDPVACQRAFDRHDELGGLAGRGVDLLVRGRHLLRERDLDVQRLKDQIAIDRAACQAQGS